MADSSQTKSILSNEEIAFPRGGSSALTPLEVKEISNAATQDVLFDSTPGKRGGETGSTQAKKKRKSSKKGSQVSQDADEQVHIPIEIFSFKSLLNGTTVLGQVSHIGKTDVEISLGDNIVGYVPFTSISEEVTSALEGYQESDESESDDEEAGYENEDKDKEIKTATISTSEKKQLPSLQDLFTLGSWLIAKVYKPDNERKKRIQLSVEPHVLNRSLEKEDLISGNIMQCSIISVEDHGVILNTGLPNLGGFISNKDIASSGRDFDSLHAGQVILCSIINKPSGRTIGLKPLDSVAGSKNYVTSSISSIDAIQPGSLVDALVSEITKNGLVLKVFGMVDATINLANLHVYDYQELKHKYTVSNTIKARVTAVLPRAGTKRLMLSHLPQITSLSTARNDDFNPLEAFPTGYIFEDATVISHDTNYIYVNIGTSYLQAQVHVSRIDPDKTLSIDYYSGSKHKARVVGYNKYENLLVLSFEPKVINAPYLSVSDIPDGTFIEKCEVLKILPNSGGLEVKVFDEFNAIVPPEHMSDIRLVYPERKFRIGGKVKSRVLSKRGKNLFITIKKSLVNIEDQEVLSNFDDAKIGFKTPATIEKFVYNGAIVNFFGNLKAFLPKSEISETFVEKASDYLRLGQTVNVRILSVNKEQKRLVVTLKQSVDLSESQKSSLDDIHPGKTITPATVVEKQKESVIVELSGSKLRGVIYSGHLSDDNYEQNRAIFNKLKVNDELQVLVLEKDLKARSVICTAKKSLIEAASNGMIPAYFKDIKVDDRMLRGFVKSVTNMGLFISFAGKLTGLVLAKYATDRPNENLAKKFYKYKSVSCRVIRVDEENKRFLLSLKKDNNSSDTFNDEPLQNPVDKSKAVIGDYSVGVVTKAIIKSIRGTQLNVQLSDNLQGRVDVTQCFNDWSEIKDKKQPLSKFAKNTEITVKVIGYHDAKNHKFLPITHRKSAKQLILELSMLSREIEKPNEPYRDVLLRDIPEGSEVVCFVNNIVKGFVWVSLTPNLRGHISLMDLSDDVSVYEDLENKVPIGMAIKATAKEIDSEHNSLVLTARKNTLNSIKDVKVGQKVPARIIKVKETYVLVQLGDKLIASSFITDALNNYSDKLSDVFHVNEFACATILAVDEANDKVAVSLRNQYASDKLITSHKDLKQEDVVRGFVKNIANNGVYVSLGRTVHALVRVSDLSDSYLKDWKKFFKPNQPVIGKVSAINEDGKILLTLKESEVYGKLNVLKKFNDLKVGDIFEGSIKQVTNFGVFVKLDGTVGVTGLCHHSEIADKTITDVSSLFGEGDRVKVKVLAIDESKKQLSLGMKASYFTDGSVSEKDDAEDVEMSNEGSEMEEDSSSDDEDQNDSDDEVMDDAFDGNEEDSDSASEEESTQKNDDKVTGLSTNGFDWTASILDQVQDEESSSDEEDFTREKPSKKKSKAQVKDKTADINSRAPQSVSDFERLLIANSDSSILWMNYMSFQLQLGEIDKAREIGERALKSINFREEQEKMNIWIALLNLENTFGSDESLTETFKRSCQYMDSLIMHQKMVGIFVLSEKYDKASSLYNTMIKKFGKNVNVWVQYASYLLDREMNEEVHEILARSLQALPKKEHIEVVRKFAQLEFTKGDPEQGRSLFEGLIADAPKRIDLWNVYIDQEIKKGDKKKVEDLFERVVTKKLSKKQARFFFNKWHSFEDSVGDQAAVARVKAKAMEYVNQFQSNESNDE
ncbi:Piso0_001102 [Millerozyma farinosa CBS 7064]|uniref:mRNA 3'-end-processing protein RNA14 n=1 Tax=Pichia sorbitophila (strain ATCC MYA-4447 / BCRC 22081 / CBS 7064 / NBRC 10061 / NRRL Y-12695) TaxID=559304 RepID=G8YSE2_PICSO|nr:Piso0_001102 [Millerozyma farinosa CBS 7064]CCE79065.1 Piso0_001102 [Millerozyma farinosa CBS 7064]